jgi:hypothetical protein
LLLRRHASGLPRDIVNARLQQACAHVSNRLSEVQRSLEAPVPQRMSSDSKAGMNGESPPMPAVLEAEAWSGWALLQRRLSLLQADADKIAARGVVIGRALN